MERPLFLRRARKQTFPQLAKAGRGTAGLAWGLSLQRCCLLKIVLCLPLPPFSHTIQGRDSGGGQSSRKGKTEKDRKMPESGPWARGFWRSGSQASGIGDAVTTVPGLMGKPRGLEGVSVLW